MSNSQIRNPEKFAKRKAERAKREPNAKEVDPKYMSILKDVPMMDGSKKNIPVGDILRFNGRHQLLAFYNKYPKYQATGRQRIENEALRAKTARPEEKSQAETPQKEAQQDRKVISEIVTLPQATGQEVAARFAGSEETK